MRALRTASTVMIVAGALLLADAALTVAWQEPVSALLGRLSQDRLEEDLSELEGRGLSAVERRALARIGESDRRLEFLARRLRGASDDGDPIGRVLMPSIGAASVMVQGTGTADLRKGPGHYPETPLPGMRGTVAVAGHRTTYLAPFRNIDDLDRGDEVELEMPYGRFIYRVVRTRIVPPSARWVTRRTSRDRVVLTACHPLYSAAKRIVVFADLSRVEPRGQGASVRGVLSPPASANGVAAL